MLEIAESGAAKLLLDGDAMQPERAHFRPEGAREPVLAFDLIGERRNSFAGKARHARTQEIGGLAEAEIEIGRVLCVHGSFTVGRNSAQRVFRRFARRSSLCGKAQYALRAIAPYASSHFTPRRALPRSPDPPRRR